MLKRSLAFSAFLSWKDALTKRCSRRITLALLPYGGKADDKVEEEAGAFAARYVVRIDYIESLHMKALSTRAKALIFAALISVACSASCEDWTGYDPVDIDFSVSGFVKDSRTNAALAGTTVTVQGKSVMSDDAGYYSIDELRAGKAQLIAQREGYKNYAAEVIVEVFTVHHIKMEPK